MCTDNNETFLPPGSREGIEKRVIKALIQITVVSTHGGSAGSILLDGCRKPQRNPHTSSAGRHSSGQAVPYTLQTLMRTHSVKRSIQKLE